MRVRAGNTAHQHSRPATLAADIQGGSVMGSVHQLKLTLKGTKPPVWRRLQVPSAATLEDLHQVICAAFDWHGGHLHEFDAGGPDSASPTPTIMSPWKTSGE